MKSCVRFGVLRINWRIIQAHIPLIEYVLVHELTNLGHRSHDRKFWDSVAQWLPDYEQRRPRLRELGPSLVKNEAKAVARYAEGFGSAGRWGKLAASGGVRL